IGKNSYSQLAANPPYKELDSLYNLEVKTVGDWQISLSVLDFATIPLYDSLGNAEFVMGTNGAFVLSHRSGKFYLQFFNTDHDYPNHTRKFTPLGKVEIKSEDYPKISLETFIQSEKEFIYPF